MPGKPRPASEKGAIALMFPAGVVGYFLRGDWPGTSILIPSVLSGLLIAILISVAKPSVKELLWPLVAPALVTMHLLGAATIGLLASAAIPDMATRPRLMPVLEWTRPTALALFAVIDLVALLIVGLALRKR